jgi:hypothetical protein
MHHYYDAAKITAEVSAARHHRRFPHHRIMILKVIVEHVMTEQTSPLFDDDVPF